MTNVREIAEAIRDALAKGDTLPIPLRALIAGTLMCARGGAPSRLGMATVGKYSYGSSQNHYSDLLDAIVNQLPSIVAEMAAGEIDPVTTARLRVDLRQRDETIGSLRRELSEANARRDEVRRYALALHARLAEIDAQASAKAGATVRTLRPLL